MVRGLAGGNRAGGEVTHDIPNAKAVVCGGSVTAGSEVFRMDDTKVPNVVKHTVTSTSCPTMLLLSGMHHEISSTTCFTTFDLAYSYVVSVLKEMSRQSGIRRDLETELDDDIDARLKELNEELARDKSRRAP